MVDNNSNKRERERDPIVPALNLSGINQQSYGGGGTTDLDTDRLKESSNSKQSRRQKNSKTHESNVSKTPITLPDG